MLSYKKWKILDQTSTADVALLGIRQYSLRLCVHPIHCTLLVAKECMALVNFDVVIKTL